MNCPLCNHQDCVFVGNHTGRNLLYCGMCTLVHAPEDYHLSYADEKIRYDLHDNSKANSGYVAYLSKVADAIAPYVNQYSRVLDFGCGKEAVLTLLLRQREITCDSYDPLYGFGIASGGNGYDVIIMCEVIEHCRNLKEILAHLSELLLPGGYLLVKTQLYPSLGNISKWWYAADPTHIMLFSDKSIDCFAGYLPGRIEKRLAADLFLLRKDGDTLDRSSTAI